jgi:Zn-dependent peptidase ImmA (M78 family)
VEDEASRFAAEFLMPADEIADQLDGLTLQQAAMQKQRWKVSMAAVVRRAYDLGRISEYKYRSLNVSLSSQGYKLVEPFPLDPEEPQAVRQMVELYCTALGYDNFDLAKLLFSPDPQFFAPSQCPTILKFNNQPFFAFFPENGGNRRATM